MSSSLSEAIKWLGYVWERRRTKHGILLWIGLVLAAGFGVPASWDFSKNQIVIGVLTAGLMSVALWTVYSGRRLLPSKRIKIALAFRSLNPKARPIILQAIHRMKEILDEAQVAERFKFLEIGTDIVNTGDEARRYIDREKVSLLLTGTVYAGKAQDIMTYDFGKLRFAYRYAEPGWDPDFRQRLQTDIQLLSSGRDWKIQEPDDLEGVSRIAQHLAEIILGIIATSVSQATEFVDLSVLLIERVLPMLERKVKPEERTVQIKEGRARVSRSLVQLLRLKEILKESYMFCSMKYARSGEFQKAKDLALKALKIGATPDSCHTRLAFVEFHLGNIPGAEAHTNKISRSNPSYRINMAFFAIRKGAYEQAVDEYEELRKLFKEKRDRHMVEGVLEFLEQQARENPAESGFVFAMGVLRYNYLDRELGRRLLGEFLSKTRSASIYNAMIAKAEQILN